MVNHSPIHCKGQFASTVQLLNLDPHFSLPRQLKMTLVLSVDQVKAVYKDFLKSPKKLNSLLPFLDTLEHCTDLGVFEVSVQAVLGSLRKCIEQGLLFAAPLDGSESVEANPEDQLREWIKDFFWSFVNILLTKLTEEGCIFAETCFEAILAVIEVRYDSDRVDFPNIIYMQLVEACFKTKLGLKLLRQAMQEYSDLRFYGYRNIAKMLTTENCDLEDVFELLLGLPWRVDPSAKESVRREFDPSLEAHGDTKGDTDSAVSSGSSIEYSSTEESEEEDVGDDESLFYLPVTKTETSKNRPLLTTDKGHRHEFSACWMTLLSKCTSMPTVLLLKVLDALDERVMPGLTQPVLLLDFLTESYNTYGWQALGSLWRLMRLYGLDYPNFYPQLYSLITPAISVHLENKHAMLLEMFLRSTHIPASYAASFAKRLAELAVFAPPFRVQSFFIPLIYNLLKRHPMLTQQMLECDSTNVLLADTNRITGVISPLYEILTLARHHHHPLAVHIRQLFLESRTLSKHVRMEDAPAIASYDDMIEKELEHRWSKVPPTQITISDELFDN